MNQSHPPIAWLSTDRPALDGGPAHHDEQNWINSETLCVSVHDIGFRQSAIAVERLRTYGGRPACLPQHIVRWRRTLDALALPIFVDEQEIVGRITELIRRNEDWLRQQGECGITMLATPGCNPNQGAGATEILHLNPLDHAKIQHHRHQGQAMVITDVQQPPEKCWPRDIKVRCRLHYYLADRAAQQIDPDAVGVLLDADGSVTETSIANLAICREGSILSPPPAQVLPGVTQQVVEQLAQQLRFTWTHTTLFPADLRQADEVWLMGTDGGLWFVNRVDGVAIGDGHPGPIYQTFLNAFDTAIRQHSL